MNRRAPRWYVAVSFLGGCSFLGFHFLPTWLMAPLFFVTPAVGPLLLLIVGAAAMRAGHAAGRPRLFATTLAACAILLIPVGALDFLLFAALPYIGLLIVLAAVPYHLICVGVFAAGLWALARLDGRSTAALRLGLAAAAGAAAGIALAVVRIEIVPQSRGVFLEAFSASGDVSRLSRRLLDPHGQRDVAETLGAQPRGHHEPIADIDDSGLWIARRSAEIGCNGYWIERRTFAPGGHEWRRCLPTAPAPTRNLTAAAHDPTGGLFIVGFDVLLNRAELAWLRRYDADGVEDRRWDRSFGAAAATINRAYDVTVAPGGAVYVSGESGELDRRGTNGWVQKFAADGSEIAGGYYGRFSNAGERRPTMAAIAAAADRSGNVYVVLNLYNSYSLRRLDAGGGELWEQPLPDRKDLAIVADDGGNLLLSGAAGYPDQAWIRKVNADGSVAWEKTFSLGHLSSTLAVATDRAGNLFAAGYGTEPDDKASYWWIKKLAADGGSEQWSTVLRGPNNDNAPFQLRVTEGGNVYALGKGSGWQFSGSRLERYWGW